MENKTLTFRESDHTYWYGDLQIPGATGLLEFWGFIDKTYYTEIPREVGTNVHLGTSSLDRGNNDYMLFESEPVIKRIEAYQKFERDMLFEPIEIEKICFAEDAYIACRLDRVGRIKRTSEILLELKCGAMAKWHPLQTAIQVICLNRPGVRRFALYLKPDGNYSLVEHTDRMQIGIVRALISAYWYCQKHGIKLKGGSQS